VAENKFFIAIAGNIGAGKSTLTELLSERLCCEPFYEANAENPYLADFYGDMKRWSFHSQVFFLGKRLEAHRLLVDHPTSVVQDRTVYEDAEIFARNLYEQGAMSTRDYDAYWALYRAVSSFLPPPDLLVYLQSSVDTLVAHIARRGRDYERAMERDYLERLNRLYDQLIDGWTQSPVLRISMDERDFAGNPADLDYVVNAVRTRLMQPQP
jgi:deoxyadenosine/deoxycytidine kinase